MADQADDRPRWQRSTAASKAKSAPKAKPLAHRPKSSGKPHVKKGGSIDRGNVTEREVKRKDKGEVTGDGEGDGTSTGDAAGKEREGLKDEEDKPKPPPARMRSNLSNFFIWRLQTAVNAFDTRQILECREICKELLRYPLLSIGIRAQVYHLLHGCAISLEQARGYIEEAHEVIEEIAQRFPTAADVEFLTTLRDRQAMLCNLQWEAEKEAGFYPSDDEDEDEDEDSGEATSEEYEDEDDDMEDASADEQDEEETEDVDADHSSDVDSYSGKDEDDKTWQAYVINLAPEAVEARQKSREQMQMVGMNAAIVRLDRYEQEMELEAKEAAQAAAEKGASGGPLTPPSPPGE